MTKHTKSRSKNKRPVAPTPLLDWRPCPPRQPETRAGLHIARRFHVNPAIADLIASLAGLGVNAEVI